MTEAYFSSRRKDEVDLNSEEFKTEEFKTYYKFYNYLSLFQQEYEKTDNSDQMRKTLIANVFHLAHKVVGSVIEDLWNTCDCQDFTGKCPRSLF